MPRQPSFTSDQLTERALQCFWNHGYNGTSMDTLVQSTQISRHGIYATYGGKKGLFLACFPRYQDLVVAPAFSRVEEPHADLESIAAYFETQIACAEEVGLPGPGCFVANIATEIAPHDSDALAKVTEHNERLRAGFENALKNAAQSRVDDRKTAQLADFCVVFTNGLWSLSRVTANSRDLRTSVKILLDMLKRELS